MTFQNAESSEGMGKWEEGEFSIYIYCLLPPPQVDTPMSRETSSAWVKAFFSALLQDTKSTKFQILFLNDLAYLRNSITRDISVFICFIQFFYLIGTESKIITAKMKMCFLSAQPATANKPLLLWF